MRAITRLSVPTTAPSHPACPSGPSRSWRVTRSGVAAMDSSAATFPSLTIGMTTLTKGRRAPVATYRSDVTGCPVAMARASAARITGSLVSGMGAVPGSITVLKMCWPDGSRSAMAASLSWATCMAWLRKASKSPSDSARDVASACIDLVSWAISASTAIEKPSTSRRRSSWTRPRSRFARSRPPTAAATKAGRKHRRPKAMRWILIDNPRDDPLASPRPDTVALKFEKDKS